MRRFLRVAAARWWIPLLVGLLAMGGGVVALRARNASITPQFEAQAFFKVQQGSSGQRTEQSQDTLRSAVDRAIEANQDLLRKGNATVSSDQENFSIVFSARDSEREGAADLAEQLRTNFVVAEFGAVQIEERMELLLAEAIEVSLALDALEPPVSTTVPAPVLDATTQARLDFLLIQVGALTSQSAKLVGDLVLAETGEDRNGTPSEIQSQIDSVKEKLAAIYAELATIPGYDPEMLEEAQAQGRSPGQTGQAGGQAGQQIAGGGDGGRGGESAGGPIQSAQTDVSIPEDESEIAPGFQQSALEERYAAIKADYEKLFVASLTGATGDLDPAEVRDATPEVLPLILGAGVGFGLGVLLAIASLFFIGRVRKPVWATADLAPLPVLADIPLAPSHPGPRFGRRRTARHRRAIQDFRGSMIGLLASRSQSISVGLEGVRAPSRAVDNLVEEVGASLQAADRNVLVIDVDFRPEGPDPVSTPTTASLLELIRLDPEAASSQLKEVFNEAGPGPSGLRMLPAGHSKAEPSDIILARPFGQLLKEALTYADVVMLRIPEGKIVADSLYQRLDGVVAVCRARRARERDLVKMAIRLGERRADLIGAVLLRGRRRHFFPGGESGISKGQGDRFLWLGRLDPRKLKGRLWPRYGLPSRKLEPAVPGEESAREAATTGVGLRERAKQWISLPNRSRLARARVRLRMPTSQWRALPDFLVIGAQRSGTSSLFKYLGHHPSISPSIRKETEYFTRRHSLGEAWYRAHFPLAERFKNGGRHLSFEADPSYLLDPRAPLRASDLVPDAKLIVVLRDPVTRAISHYKHNVRIGQEKATLEEALDREGERLAGEVERMWQDPGYPATQYLRYSYATRGLYAEQLERWLEFFPSSSLRIVKSEDLFRNPSQVLTGLLDFLEVAPWQPNGFANASSARSETGQVPPETVVERLRSYFMPYNLKLYSLVGEDFGW
jgi:hypothetical protein